MVKREPLWNIIGRLLGSRNCDAWHVRYFCPNWSNFNAKDQIEGASYFIYKSRVEKDLPDDQGRLVKRYLPHGKKSHFVYEIVMSEREYQRNSKVLSNFLTHPDFEGIYEKHTPLLLRVLVRLGCVARVSNSAALARRRAKAGTEERERPYSLDEMEFLTTATHNYLDFNESQHQGVKRIYLYHSRRGSWIVVSFSLVSVSGLKVKTFG